MTENEPILETERLALHRWTEADGEALAVILSDEEVVRHVDDGKPFSREKTMDFLRRMKAALEQNGFCRWKVVEKSSGETIGSCGFGRIAETGEIELGYLLRRSSWGSGYATEIAGAAALYGFENLGFREIIALTDLDNAASHKVLRKIGFAPRGVEIIGGEKNLVFVKKKSDE